MRRIATILLIWPMALFGLAGCADITIKDSHIQTYVKNAEAAISVDMLDYAYSNLYYIKSFNTVESEHAYNELLNKHEYELQIGGKLSLLKRAKSVLNAGNYNTFEELKNSLSKELYFYKIIATHQQFLAVLDAIEVAYIQHRAEKESSSYLDGLLTKHPNLDGTHCDITVVSDLCPGGSLYSLRKKMVPLVEKANGNVSVFLFDIDGYMALAISYRGHIAAIIKRHKPTSWLELATLKLRLERQGIRWKTELEFPDDVTDQESRVQAILSGEGSIRLNSWNNSIELEWSGPTGIKITHYHPALWLELDEELVDYYWQELSTSVLPTTASKLKESTKTHIKKSEKIQSTKTPIIAIIHRHNTSILGNRQRISDLEIEGEFVECVQTSMEQVLPTAKYISSDELREALKIDDKRVDLIPALPDVRNNNHPIDINYIVVVDGTELKTESSVAAFCGGGYAGAGCFGGASEIYPYRLAVTVIDPINWTVLKQIYATTASGHKGTIAVVIPFWWTFPPDKEVCTGLGREVGKYLLLKHSTE